MRILGNTPDIAAPNSRACEPGALRKPIMETHPRHQYGDVAMRLGIRSLRGDAFPPGHPERNKPFW